MTETKHLKSWPTSFYRLLCLSPFLKVEVYGSGVMVSFTLVPSPLKFDFSTSRVYFFISKR